MARAQVSKQERAPQDESRSKAQYWATTKFPDATRDRQGEPTAQAQTQIREEKYQQMFQDPRLQHKNADFSRLAKLEEMRPGLAD